MKGSSEVPPLVADFLRQERIAVAGVSRSPSQPANAVFRKLRATGHEVFAVNPKAETVEGTRCYTDVSSLPEGIGGLVVAAPSAAARGLVIDAAARGIGRVWLHQSFGRGSVSDDAVKECAERGVTCIAGRCPLMYLPPVDVFHRCIRWWLKRSALS